MAKLLISKLTNHWGGREINKFCQSLVSIKLFAK